MPISQLKIHFQQCLGTFSMCQTHTVAKNVQIFIPTTKSDRDIEKMVKRTLNEFTQKTYISKLTD